MRWFEQIAPIRAKFVALLTIMLLLTAVSNISMWAVGQANLSSLYSLIVAILSFGLVAIVITTASRLICTPYVNTVVRMEALAAGDLDGPIYYTNHADCVGRMTKAMTIFRDNAVETKRLREEQQTVVMDGLGGSLRELANNMLDCKINEPFPGDFEALRKDFNRAIDSVRTTLEMVTLGADAVLTGASEIETASADLAHRNEEQAATLEETSATLNDLTRRVEASATAAEVARQTVAEAHKMSDEGQVVVERTIQSMSSIEESSNKISQIISVIEGIAFQTNLLALNAGVEAARAGDSGKGFAVVANEVRALAQRSADAAKDISALINESSKQVEEGVAFVHKSGDQLSKIVQQVSTINALVADISENVTNQAQSLIQINAAVGSMDTVTQQNAAMVEQASAAALSLADEARDLTSKVAVFKISKAASTNLPAESAPRAPVRRVVGKRASPRSNLALKVVEPAQEWSEF